MDPALQEANTRIQGALSHLKRELSSIRAGRATPSFIENIPVIAYGEKLTLMEVGTISAPQPTLLTVQVWDAGLMPAVVKAIQEANLGLNPSFEGQIIRLAIPPLTQERREEFIKLAHQKMEGARVELRQIRQSIRDSWQQAIKNSEFGEDELDRRQRLLQELMDQSMTAVDSLGAEKEAELGSLS